MFINKSDYRTTILKIFIVLMIAPLFAQSDEKYNATIFETGLYAKDLHFDWKPLNRKLDIHSADIREINFRFSDLDLNYIGNDKKKTASIKFSGPNLSLQELTVRSSIHSENWVTKEKIARLEKRESIPKLSIESIASGIDLYMIDHNTLPGNINELAVKQYIDMSIPPLDDYSWSYTLDLPEQIIAKPTHINIKPSAHAIYYDWQTRSFQLDPEKDSLYNVPITDWEYIFEIEKISQVFSSNIDLEISEDKSEFDLNMKRGQFRISKTSFSATPGKQLDDRSSLSLPEFLLEANDLVLNGSFSGTPVIHRGKGKFRIRNFEIKIPKGIKEEPEIDAMLKTLGIWNNSLMIRLIEFDINLINEFTGDMGFRFQTPFLKISVDGDFSFRQTDSIPKLVLHDTEVRIHPISLGMRKWLREWEQKNGKDFDRQGATIVLKINGPIENPIIQGY